jgi:hypothetical protein
MMFNIVSGLPQVLTGSRRSRTATPCSCSPPAAPRRILTSILIVSKMSSGRRPTSCAVLARGRAITATLRLLCTTLCTALCAVSSVCSVRRHLLFVPPSSSVDVPRARARCAPRGDRLSRADNSRGAAPSARCWRSRGGTSRADASACTRTMYPSAWIAALSSLRLVAFLLLHPCSSLYTCLHYTRVSC